MLQIGILPEIHKDDIPPIMIDSEKPDIVRKMVLRHPQTKVLIPVRQLDALLVGRMGISKISDGFQQQEAILSVPVDIHQDLAAENLVETTVPDTQAGNDRVGQRLVQQCLILVQDDISAQVKLLAVRVHKLSSNSYKVTTSSGKNTLLIR